MYINGTPPQNQIKSLRFGNLCLLQTVQYDMYQYTKDHSVDTVGGQVVKFSCFHQFYFGHDMERNQNKILLINSLGGLNNLSLAFQTSNAGKGCLGLVWPLKLKINFLRTFFKYKNVDSA